MPFGSEGVQEGIGLALSGGGFRATLFHLGSLWRLNELGYLPKIDRISSVSGGSITAGMLAKEYAQLQFQNGIAVDFQDKIVAPLRDFCRQDIDAPAILVGLILPFRWISELITRQYDAHLFSNITLQSLPDKPMFVFNATNMHTGVNFRFSKEYAGDYRLGLIPKPDHRVSYAVTASSAFPPFLSPVILKTEPGMFQFVDGADLWGNPDYSTQIYLTDGGVYDNMGLEPIWKRYRTVLVSDAGAPLLDQPQQCRYWHKQALRSLDISTQQSRALRKRILIFDYIQGKDTDAVPRNGTYWSIRSDITHFNQPDALPCDVNKTNALSVMRTRLNAFNDREQCELINWGYAVCDAAMRKHVLPNPPEIKPRLPYDKYPLST